jgi:hypothetical protein
VPFGGGFGKITRFFDQAMVWQIPTDEDLMVARYTHGMAFAKG